MAILVFGGGEGIWTVVEKDTPINRKITTLFCRGRMEAASWQRADTSNQDSFCAAH